MWMENVVNSNEMHFITRTNLHLSSFSTSTRYWLHSVSSSGVDRHIICAIGLKIAVLPFKKSLLSDKDSAGNQFIEQEEAFIFLRVLPMHLLLILTLILYEIIIKEVLKARKTSFCDRRPLRASSSDLQECCCCASKGRDTAECWSTDEEYLWEGRPSIYRL